MSETILNDNLIATFEQSLKQTRNAQNRLIVRLREVETERNRLRQEIDALEKSAEKTTEAIHSILATMGSNKDNPNNNIDSRYDVDKISKEYRGEDQYSRDDQYSRESWENENMNSSNRNNQGNQNYSQNDNQNNQNYQQNGYYNDSIAYIHNNQNQNNQNNQNYQNNQSYQNQNNNNNQRRNVQQIGQNIEPMSQRFAERTITQACTLLLRESNNALHVNDLYKYLLAGGFEFTGKNPTISIAVSLNRNRRFKKVAPGTFDLVMRDASQAAS